MKQGGTTRTHLKRKLHDYLGEDLFDPLAQVAQRHLPAHNMIPYLQSLMHPMQRD